MPKENKKSQAAAIRDDNASPMQRPRSSRAAAAAVVTIPRYFVAPSYGSNTSGYGASSMTATIGPAQQNSGNYGSPPGPSTPEIMRDLLDSGKLNHFGWVAGHLLNDNLGGPGVAKNLTPLTTNGNKNHLNTCESAIKNFIDASFSRTEYYKTDTYWFGVEYEVKVGEDKWHDTHPLLKFVAKKITISAKVVKKDKSTGAISDATAAETKIGCHFDAMVEVEVENTGFKALNDDMLT
jgi:hypothetical protein